MTMHDRRALHRRGRRAAGCADLPANAVHLMRTAQQTSSSSRPMADPKASMLMGATFVIFTITIGQARDWRDAAAAADPRRRGLLRGDLRGARGPAADPRPEADGRSATCSSSALQPDRARRSSSRSDRAAAHRGRHLPDDGARHLPDGQRAPAQEIPAARLCLPDLPAGLVASFAAYRRPSYFDLSSSAASPAR